MIEDWRYDDGKMNERSLAMSAFVRKGIELNRGVYEFCADFVSQGGMLSLLKEHCDGTGESPFTMEVLDSIADKVVKSYYEWVEETS